MKYYSARISVSETFLYTTRTTFTIRPRVLGTVSTPIWLLTRHWDHCLLSYRKHWPSPNPQFMSTQASVPIRVGMVTIECSFVGHIYAVTPGLHIMSVGVRLLVRCSPKRAATHDVVALVPSQRERPARGIGLHAEGC